MYTQQELIEKLTPIFEQYPIKRAALFGSYARGEQTSESDVDLLLEYDQTTDPSDYYYTLWDALEEIMRLKADVVTLRALDNAPVSFRNRVIKEMRYIYEV